MNLSTLIKKGQFLAVSILLAFNFGLSSGTMAQCAIGAVEAMPTPCNELGFFDVFLDFEYENTGTDGFTVKGNGITYGTFEYSDLPIVIYGLEGDGITFYEFEVRDIQFPDCSNFAELGIIECVGGPCNIWDLVIDDHPCVAGMFNVLIDFEYENVSDSGFALYVNYDLYGTYAYAELPLESIGPFAGDGTTVYHFYVADLEYEDCLEDANLGPIECDTLDCLIGEIDVTILPCDDNDEFMVLLDFDHVNTSTLFGVQGNGFFYGTFEYSDLPIELGPLQGDGTTVYEFLVTDVYYSCSNDTHIDPVICDSLTEFLNFTTQVVSCSDEMYELQMDFDVINGGNQGFMIIGNGEDYGSYDYDQLPVSIGPLSTDGQTPYHFIAKDKENQHYGNWDKLIPFTCENLGVSEPWSGDIINVYPNPSYGSVIFENFSERPVSVYLYNSNGAEVALFNMTDAYQVNELEAGMYYYQILSEGKVVISGKLVVTR